MQFDGPGTASLNLDDRMTIANMAIEAGGKNGIFEFDAQTEAFVVTGASSMARKPVTNRSLGTRTKSSFMSLWLIFRTGTDGGLPSRPGQRKLAKELGQIKLDRAYIGSCTGGKTSDFLEFARILRGRRVVIDTFGVPATPEIVHDLQTARWGDSTVWDILVAAGVQMTENAGCAALPGRAGGHLRPHERAAQMHSATNRNFPGRMGHKESQVFLLRPRPWRLAR